MIDTEYGGYIVKVYDAPIAYKIIEKLAGGKFKNRRTTQCNQYTGKRDHHGNKLYTPFESVEQAFDRAKKYVDNYIVPWAESPNNQQSKNYKHG